MPSIKRKNGWCVDQLDLDADLSVDVRHTTKWSVGPIDEDDAGHAFGDSKWTVSALDKVFLPKQKRKTELENLVMRQPFPPLLITEKTSMVDTTHLVFPGETYEDVMIERERYDALLYIDDEEWFPK